jgi:antitoxin component HigA of HigAB toxin-antitoxin module
MRHRYNFDLLFRHSNEIANATRRDLKTQIAEARRIFGFLDQHFSALEQKGKSHSRNVKMALTARFINNMFAALMLVERGLLLDAFNSLRSGIEVTAFYWLVCKDTTTAALYDAQKSPQPVEVRKRLEALGVDVNALRELYGLASNVAHVGNQYDQLQIQWEREKDGKLLIGGGSRPDVQRAMLEDIVRAVFRFVRFDDDYVVPDIDSDAGAPI